MTRRRILSSYARERIKILASKGASVSEILIALDKDGVVTCRQTVWRIIQHINTHGSIHPLPKSGRRTVLTNEVLNIIDIAMQADDETTAKQLCSKLSDVGILITERTVLKGRHLMGWTSRGAAYCQLIRDQNQLKRLDWAKKNLGAGFEDVIWTDETTVQLETHRRFCCRKQGQKPRYKPRPKHPIKVHVWAGISWRGATNVCIFEGIMDANLYTDILNQFLVPFVQTVYPHGHKFMQDNDPKHTSRHSKRFFEEKGINWWPTPPESPDANPIENLWHELKVSLSV